MIIVLLLFFQSICLYCQRLVLYIHDRWINPKNVRLLKEAAESSAAHKLLLQQQPAAAGKPHGKAVRKRYATVRSGEHGAAGILAETCRFCANSPQGYCRHHFHLQELEVQKQQQQQRFWNPLAVAADKTQELRQLRKINRELRRNLKNRLNAHQQQQQQQQQPTPPPPPPPPQGYQQQKKQQQQPCHNHPQQYGSDLGENIEGHVLHAASSHNSTATLTHSSSASSGFQSWTDVSLQEATGSDAATADSGIATPVTLETTTYYFEANASASTRSSSPVSVAAASDLAANSTITTTYL